MWLVGLTWRLCASGGVLHNVRAGLVWCGMFAVSNRKVV